MSDGEVANEVKAFPEIGVPELVAAGEGLEGPLIDYESLLERGIGPSDQVAPPQLEAEWVTEDLFFVEQILLRRIQLLSD